MSDINLLYTAQTKTVATGKPLIGNGVVLGNGTGVFSIGPGSFFDFIFSSLVDKEQKKNEEGNSLSLLLTPQTTPDNSVKTEIILPDLQTKGIIDIDADTTIDSEVSVLDVSGIESSAISLQDVEAKDITILDSASTITEIRGTDYQTPVSTLAVTPPVLKLDPAGQKKLNATLENLLQGLPADQRPVIVNIQPGQIQKIISHLKINANSIQGDSQNLIATGLTPEQLEKLVTLIGKGKITDDQSDDSTDDVAVFLVGIVKMMPDSSGKEAIFIPRALFVNKPENTAQPNESPKASDELAASLNALSVGKSKNSSDSIPVPAVPTGDETISPGFREQGFGDALESLEQIQQKDSAIRNTNPPAVSDSTPKNATGTPGPVNSTLGTGFSSMIGSLMNSASLNDLFPDGMDWSQNQISALNGTHVSGSAQLASLVTQAQQATQPHPTTQMIAATLTRAARNGEDQTLRLQLDPPELGRIEIQMHFTKDKTMKAHMVIEKPETMLMMQRDSQVLERALHDSGVDVSGNSLSFELASHEQSFNGNHGNTGGHENDSGYAASINTDDIIETTMTWYVDSETGHQHYSLLA